MYLNIIMNESMCRFDYLCIHSYTPVGFINDSYDVLNGAKPCITIFKLANKYCS